MDAGGRATQEQLPMDELKELQVCFFELSIGTHDIQNEFIFKNNFSTTLWLKDFT